MHVLVTGGAGFIGSVTTQVLLERGHDVTVLDDLSTGHADAVPDGASFVRGDLRDRAVLDEVLDPGDIDACVHFAALIEAGESMREPERFFEMNTGGSAILVRALVEHAVERFVLSSTAAVYGEPSPDLLVDDRITEDLPNAPTNAYGESKLLVERVLRWTSELRPFRYAALRYFNAAGATDERGERHDPETHLVPLVLQVAEGTRDQIAIFGTDYPTPDGTAVRDYIHVEDLARAHAMAIDALDTHRSITCNLGTGRGTSVREVVESVRRVTGHRIPADEQDRRAGDPAFLVADASRARTLLGWEAEHTDIDDIVGSAWALRQRRAAA